MCRAYGSLGSPAGVNGREKGDCVPDGVPGVPGLGVPIGLPSFDGGNESPVAPIPWFGACFGRDGMPPVVLSIIDRGREFEERGSRACAAADGLASACGDNEVGGASWGGDVCGVMAEVGSRCLSCADAGLAVAPEPDAAGVKGGVCMVDTGGECFGVGRPECCCWLELFEGTW